MSADTIYKKNVLMIDGRLPTLNDLIRHSRGNRFSANHEKQLYQSRIRTEIRRQGLSAMRAPVKVTFKFFEANARRDPDNVFAGGHKLILDALQIDGIIENDNLRWLAPPKPISDEIYIDAERPRIEVVIEEYERH